MARKFWSTGITVRPHCGGFVGVVEISDDYFADPKAAHIRLTTYVLDTIRAAIDSVRASAEDLGIEWRNINDVPRLYMYSDGEDSETQYPHEWRTVLQHEATRIGWVTYPEREPA